MFVARSSIGFLPMPLRFLTLPSRGACRVVETYMYVPAQQIVGHIYVSR